MCLDPSKSKLISLFLYVVTLSFYLLQFVLLIQIEIIPPHSISVLAHRLATCTYNSHK